MAFNFLGVNDILDIVWFNRPNSMMDSWVAVIGTMAIKPHWMEFQCYYKR